MDLILNYDESVDKSGKLDKPFDNLLYLAKPVYGGWVTFTAHLSHKYQLPIYKIAGRNETFKRNYGYECQYQNIDIGSVIKLKNILITAIDKHYYKYLNLFPENTKVIIHDPTECKPNKKTPNPLVQTTEDNEKTLLNHFKIITIRESVQEYLMNRFNVESQFMPHPFYSYELPKCKGLGYEYVSISRIDFDKNTDIILRCNQSLKDTKKHIYLFGAENRLYVHHKLKELNFSSFWKGKFPKNLSPTYENCSILKDAKYMIDMSIIKGDGGGTQYTFLEAIHQDTVLILHNEWIDAGSTFKSGHNCIGVSNHEELSNFIDKGLTDEEYQNILMNSKVILENHI
jgi:hypothetical protein